MKVVGLMFLIFMVPMYFLGSNEIDIYTTNIEIEKNPAYIDAKIVGITRHKDDPYTKEKRVVIHYAFEVGSEVYRGATNVIYLEQALKYIKARAVKIAYYADDPEIHVQSTAFREGQTTRLFHDHLMVIAILSAAIAIPLGLFLGWLFGWFKKNKA